MVAVMKDLLPEWELEQEFEDALEGPFEGPFESKSLHRPQRPGHLRLVTGTPAVPSPRHGAPQCRRSPAPTRRHRADAAVYRRRRLVAAAVLVIGMLGAAHVVEAFGAGPLAASERPTRGTAYTVHPGDTVWSIARQFEPTGDPRPLVDALVAQHGGSRLDVGDVLRIPVG